MNDTGSGFPAGRRICRTCHWGIPLRKDSSDYLREVVCPQCGDTTPVRSERERLRLQAAGSLICNGQRIEAKTLDLTELGARVSYSGELLKENTMTLFVAKSIGFTGRKAQVIWSNPVELGCFQSGLKFVR